MSDQQFFTGTSDLCADQIYTMTSEWIASWLKTEAAHLWTLSIVPPDLAYTSSKLERRQAKERGEARAASTALTKTVTALSGCNTFARAMLANLDGDRVLRQKWRANLAKHISTVRNSCEADSKLPEHVIKAVGSIQTILMNSLERKELRHNGLSPPQPFFTFAESTNLLEETHKLIMAYMSESTAAAEHLRIVTASMESFADNLVRENLSKTVTDSESRKRWLNDLQSGGTVPDERANGESDHLVALLDSIPRPVAEGGESDNLGALLESFLRPVAEGGEADTIGGVAAAG